MPAKQRYLLMVSMDVSPEKETLFNGYEKLGNVMFVNSQSKKQIIYSQDE